jgi:iron complex transport system substrate-binding protein
MRRRRWSRWRGLAALGVTLLLATAGCVAEVDDSASSAGSEPGRNGPATVENCGEEVTYESVPERAVSYDIGMTEILLSLGLADRMRGYVLNAVYDLGIESSEYRTS